MKRISIAFIIMVSLTNCTKESSSTCYHCTFGTINNVQPPPVDYCGDDGGTRQFKDAQGNDLSTICTKK